MSAKILLNSLYLISATCLLIAGVWFLQRYGYFVSSPQPVIGDVQVAGASSYTGDFTTPSALSIPAIDVSLPVVITHMEGKKWPTTPSGVSYLANSAIPGDIGNAVFYGHNWPAILGGLKDAKIGDRLVIQYQDGKSRDFTINKVFVVGPDSTEILAQSNTPQITVYTCTGFLDTKRLVITAI